MNNLYTFNALQLSEQLAQIPKHQHQPRASKIAPLKSAQHMDSKQSKKFRRYEQIFQIIEEDKSKELIQEQKNEVPLKKFISSNLNDTNPISNPFSTLTHKRYEINFNENKQKRKSATIIPLGGLSNQFTFYPKQTIQSISTTKKVSREYQSLSHEKNKKRSRSLKIQPKLFLPASDKKLPQAFKFRLSGQKKAHDDAIRQRIPSANKIYDSRYNGEHYNFKLEVNKIGLLPSIDDSKNTSCSKLSMSSQKIEEQEFKPAFKGRKHKMHWRLIKQVESKLGAISADIKKVKKYRLPTLGDSPSENEEDCKGRSARKQFAQYN